MIHAPRPTRRTSSANAAISGHATDEVDAGVGAATTDGGAVDAEGFGCVVVGVGVGVGDVVGDGVGGGTVEAPSEYRAMLAPDLMFDRNS